MKKSTLEKFIERYPNVDTEVDILSLLESVNKLYKSFGCKVEKDDVAKDIIDYASCKCEICWSWLMTVLSMLLKFSNPNVFDGCSTDIDWKEVCDKCVEYDNRFKPVLENIEPNQTQELYKKLFYLVAKQNEIDPDYILGEFTMDAYGWAKVLKDVVSVYQDYICLEIK